MRTLTSPLNQSLSQGNMKIHLNLYLTYEYALLSCLLTGTWVKSCGSLFLKESFSVDQGSSDNFSKFWLLFLVVEETPSHSWWSYFHTAFRKLWARLTTGDAKGDLKLPSSSPFPFPGPIVVWVERSISKSFYFTRIERVQLGMLMPRNFSGCNLKPKLLHFYLQQHDIQLWNYFLPLETPKKFVFITDQN